MKLRGWRNTLSILSLGEVGRYILRSFRTHHTHNLTRTKCPPTRLPLPNLHNTAAMRTTRRLNPVPERVARVDQIPLTRIERLAQVRASGAGGAAEDGEQLA